MDKSKVNILTPLHTEALDLFFSDENFRKAFYLSEGTALAAFYLGHRYSDDLDFFCHDSSLQTILPLLKRLEKSGVVQIKQRTPDFIRASYKQELQIDFIRDVPFRIGLPHSEGLWQIDSLNNISVNKVTAILGRLDIKDYVDLYFLIKNKPNHILDLLEYAKKKDASIDVFLWSKVIQDVEGIEIFPRMISSITHKTLVKFYKDLKTIILESLK